MAEHVHPGSLMHHQNAMQGSIEVPVSLPGLKAPPNGHGKAQVNVVVLHTSGTSNTEVSKAAEFSEAGL